MNEELGYHREEGEEKSGGEGPLEWSERSERNGSGPSPPTRSPEGEPSRESVSEEPGACEVGGLELAWASSPEVPASSPDVSDTSAPDLTESPIGDAGLSDEEWEGSRQSPAKLDAASEGADEDWEVAPMPPNLTARRRGTLSKPSQRSQAPLSAQQKLLLLDTWQRSGLPARDFAALVHISHHTLYTWKKKFEQLGPAGLMDQPKGAKVGSRLPELTKRSILMLKQSHPDWGCQRISDMLLRGPALPASPSAVARVLHEAGYEMEETVLFPRILARFKC